MMETNKGSQYVMTQPEQIQWFVDLMTMKLKKDIPLHVEYAWVYNLNHRASKHLCMYVFI